MNNELIEHKSWWKRNWKWVLLTSGLIITFIVLLFSSGMGLTVTNVAQAYMDTELYENALKKVKSDKRVFEILGEIKEIDKFAILEGSVKYSENNKTVNSSIRLKGTKGKGMMDISANLVKTNWNYAKVNVRIEKPADKKQTIEIIAEE